VARPLGQSRFTLCSRCGSSRIDEVGGSSGPEPLLLASDRCMAGAGARTVGPVVRQSGASVGRRMPISNLGVELQGFGDPLLDLSVEVESLEPRCPRDPGRCLESPSVVRDDPIVCAWAFLRASGCRATACPLGTA
jgi:hypothetical protein